MQKQQYLQAFEAWYNALKIVPANKGPAIGDTVFHVTVAPSPGVFLKCQENFADGLKVYLIIPDSRLFGARQMAESYGGGQIAIESLESFISQNIDELSAFRADRLKTNFIDFIHLYNKRVNEAEVDKSLMIELPSNLLKSNG